MRFGASGRRGAQRGAVSVVLALALALLVGMAGLVFDLGRLFVIKGELQTAMDACALAAARQLAPGRNDPNALVRADAHGRALSDAAAVSLAGLARTLESLSRYDFQASSVAPSALDIRFASSLEGPWLTAAQASGSASINTASFARCAYDATRIPLGLVRVVGAPATAAVAASAVGSLAPSQVSCGFPLAVCKAPGSTADASPAFGLVPGQWISQPTAGKYGAGHFGWIDFSPPNGGADELATLIEGRGACELKLGIPVGESGVKASLIDSWNKRFGLYGSGGASVASSPGDFSGYAYTVSSWPRGREAWSGSDAGSSKVPSSNYQHNRAVFAPYQGNGASGVNAKFSVNWTASQRRAQGRDRRLVVTPVIDCSAWNTDAKARPKIEAWACSLLLSPIGQGGIKTGESLVEYLGLVNVGNSPCASSGLPGGAAAGGPLVPVLVQ